MIVYVVCKCGATLTELGYCPFCNRNYVQCEQCLEVYHVDDLTNGLCIDCMLFVEYETSQIESVVK
jgi:hypothetical protein